MATFSPPDEFDAVALARSMDKALKILLPWCQLPNSYVSFTPQFVIFLEASYSFEFPFVGDIAALALSCVEAIKFSVVGARNGFAIVEETIILGDLNRNSTVDEHQSYLAGMLVLGKDFCKNAAEMVQRFRDVRSDIFEVCCLFLCCPLVLTCSDQLLRNVGPEHERVEFECSIHINGRSMSISLLLYRYAHLTLETLNNGRQDGIGDLEEFANNMHTFATWWNWMKLEADSQDNRTQLIQVNYNPLRQEIVIRKWRELRKQYVAHADEA